VVLLLLESPQVLRLPSVCFEVQIRICGPVEPEIAGDTADNGTP
jgi:hypothetical protein